MVPITIRCAASRRQSSQWAGRTFWGSIAAGFQRTAGFSAQACLEDQVGGGRRLRAGAGQRALCAGCRNYQQMAYLSGDAAALTESSQVSCLMIGSGQPQSFQTGASLRQAHSLPAPAVFVQCALKARRRVL
jgi:hypothetical protein